MYSQNITRLQIPKSPKITRNKLGHGMKKKETNVHHQATKKTSSKSPPDSELALQTMTKPTPSTKRDEKQQNQRKTSQKL
jgi:hypothetical protein